MKHVNLSGSLSEAPRISARKNLRSERPCQLFYLFL